MLVLLLPTFAFLPIASRFDNSRHATLVAWGALPLLLVTAAIGWIMTRWMMARSEIIDMNELLKLKRERDQAQISGRPPKQGE